MPEQTPLIPATDAIRRDLEFMTARWGELGAPAVFEVRAFKEGTAPKTAKFSVDWMDDAVEWIERLNELGHNIYAVRNPIRADITGSAKDEDIIAAFSLWADCDEGDAADNILRWEGPKFSASVITGSIPATRVHTYWALKEPCTDMDKWRATQVDIARHFGSDETVINPSRIMRIGGTVAYPASHKQERGYVKELTTMRTSYDDGPRAPVTIDQMQRAFGSTQPAKSTKATSGFQIDTGAMQTLDREQTRIQALQGQDWHHAVIKLVASYVSRGFTDDEIHRQTDPLTLAGYTVDQTRAEVQTAIDGARAKGWTPEAGAVRDMTDAEKEAVPAALFNWWTPMDLAAIPAPEFLYSDFFARGYTSLTVAAPKVGKSMLGLAEAIDAATGRGFLTGVSREPMKVVYYNAEDDQNAINGRVAALLTEYGIDQSEIVGRLAAISGVENDDFFMVSGQDGVINEALFVSLEKFCDEQNADLLIFDPLQDLSRSPETNEVFRLLGQRLRRMASQCQVGLGLIHHTRKVAAGVTPSIDDARGGGAIRGTARFNRILVAMTEDEGLKAGVENHRHFMRIGDMESNLAPPSADVNRWFEKASVQTPNGQYIGAIRPWEWPDAFDGISPQDARKVQLAVADMEDEPPLESNRSPQRWVGVVVANALGLDLEDAATKTRVGTMVKTWIKSGILEVVDFRDTRAGRDRRAVICGPNNPTTEENHS